MKKWFVRLYIPALMLVITAGMFFVLHFGYTPVPPIVMEQSYFDQPTEIGAVVFRRFYAPIREAKTMVFGTPLEPAFHRDILRGFLVAANGDGVHFDTLITEQQMPDLDLTGLPNTKVVRVVTNSQTQAELADAVNEAERSGPHTLIYLPSVFSTHILKGNPLTRLETMLGHGLFTITSASLPLANDQEYLVDPACVGTERDSAGVSDLGCAILSAARPFYKKAIKANLSEKENAKEKPDNQKRWVAIMNQSSQTGADYLLMVSYPGQHEGNAAENTKIRMNPPTSGRGGVTR